MRKTKRSYEEHMKSSFTWTAALLAALFMVTGCKKNKNDTWDDNSTSMGSYKRPSQRVLWGSESTSQAKDADMDVAASFDDEEEEFIPLREEDLKQQFSDMAVAQPKHSPGEEGSFLPGIDGFSFPTAALASVFRTVHFNTDEHTIKAADDITSLTKMASYLKGHPRTYIFVSGHCDQRGPEAYNLALGTRRANAVRSFLVQKGVSPEQIHTVSYGKEHLLDSRNITEAWAKNRRAEFKIYEQK
jgi:peptidoglycan-associated lipoprotein